MPLFSLSPLIAFCKIIRPKRRFVANFYVCNPTKVFPLSQPQCLCTGLIFASIWFLYSPCCLCEVAISGLELERRRVAMLSLTCDVRRSQNGTGSDALKEKCEQMSFSFQILSSSKIYKCGKRDCECVKIKDTFNDEENMKKWNTNSFFVPQKLFACRVYCDRFCAV